MINSDKMLDIQGKTNSFFRNLSLKLDKHSFYLAKYIRTML